MYIKTLPRIVFQTCTKTDKTKIMIERFMETVYAPF